MLRRLRRPRAAGAALAVALAGAAPLLASGPARAGAVAGQPETGTQVRFRGGPPGLDALWCRAEPDQQRLRVRAESKVTFVNHTGRPATVRVDGHDAGTVEANQGLPVIFHGGPVTVSMIPDCGFTLNRTVSPVMVEVTAPPTDPDNSADILLIGNPSAVAAGTVAIAAAVAVTPAPNGANLLVALVATVCVTGASVGAIRAILAQRVSSTSAA
ncbi:MAG: hypothetical protein FWJ93_01945 [Micromonosporaceae bacterium]